jgi:[ribosomal protein S5]-alanine N-acetyltransferase
MLQATITTQRLLLRQSLVADAEAIFRAYAQDPEVTRYLIWRPHPDIETTRAFLQRCVADLAHGTHPTWVITMRDDADAVVGMISLQLRDF